MWIFLLVGYTTCDYLENESDCGKEEVIDSVQLRHAIDSVISAFFKHRMAHILLQLTIVHI